MNMDKEEFLSFIENAQTDQKIDFPKSFSYKHVVFDTLLENGKLLYTWSSESKGSVINIYPMKNSNYVKYFKTLAGAKRNFIKQLSYLFKE